MKFIIKNVNQGARTGFIKDVERLPEAVYETPLLLHYTRGANLPHITRDVFESITQDYEAISVSLTNTMTFLNSIEEFKEGVAKFAAMGDCLTYLCFQDTGIKMSEGYGDKNNIPLWTRHGKMLLNPAKYIDIISKYKPDIYHTLCDDDTDPNSSEKHLCKAVSKSNKMFTQCMELHTDQKWLANNSFVLGSISGGYSITHRDNCLKNVLESKYFAYLGGISIDGFKAHGPSNENLNNTKLCEILEFVIKEVPSQLLRSVPGSFPPVSIVKLISLGVDMFDSSYANNVTERNCALVFSFNPEIHDENEAEINLAEIKYKEDFTPILKNCTCLACCKHTKAYINHLVATKELLGPVLLSIHNTHHFIQFFKAIRKFINENRFEYLQHHIEKQYKKTL